MDQGIRVIVADDEPKLRGAWERLLAKQSDLTLLALLDSADELSSTVPDGLCVVLLDLSMPGRDPLAAAAEIRDTKPQCRVVIYSGHADPDLVQQAFDAGAWGFVDKLTAPDEILDVIRRVAGGEAVVV